MKKFVLPFLFTLSIPGFVNAESLAQSLVHCDSGFFNRLYEQRNQIQKLAPVESDNAHHTWFVPPEENNGTVWFAEPLKIDDLAASGYYVQQNDLGDMGKYYYWGLVFDNSPQAVMAALPQVNWHQEEDEFSANAMIKTPEDKEWKINTGAAGGIAPAKGTIEKVALLSVSNGKTKLLCSVQGSVDNKVLGSLRPDLSGITK